MSSDTAALVEQHDGAAGIPADVAIRVSGLSKCYRIFDRPEDRLKHSFYPALRRMAGLPPRQYHRDFWALRGVSFDVRRGETVGIVGKNGSGKSTLLHLVVGTHAITEGTIDVNGRITALLELGSGFNPLFTGRENVYLNAAISGLTRAQTDARFDEIARFADIGDFMDQAVNTYSSGMYVRLAFAVQVCLDPDILVVDEALAVGDAYFVHRCFHRLRTMKEQGKTILFVSHDTAAVNNLCDRAIWISDGRLRMQGKPAEVTASYRADLFGLPMLQAAERAEADAASGARACTGGPALGVERAIPNSDRRMGHRRCRMLGVGLYDPASLARITEAGAGTTILLRASFENVELKPGAPLIFGYVVCTPRGEELGGLNSKMSGFEIPAPPKGAIMTVRASVTLPLLHRGHYAFTVAFAGYASDGGIEVEDRVENALVFHVINDHEVVGWTRLPTVFELE